MLAPLAGYKTYLAAALALAGAIVGALDGDMTWQQAAAVIVPAVIGAALRHGLSTSMASILQTLLNAAAQAADQAGKKAGALILVALVGGALSACQTLGLTGNPANDVPVAAADLVKVCKDLGPLAAPLAAAPNAQAQAAGVIAIYAASVCNGSGNVIPSVIAGLSPDTGAWAKVLLGELQAAQGLTPPAPAAPAVTKGA